MGMISNLCSSKQCITPNYYDSNLSTSFAVNSDPRLSKIKSESFLMDLDINTLDTNTFIGKVVSDDIYLALNINNLTTLT
jgi:hypothetical protein